MKKNFRLVLAPLTLLFFWIGGFVPRSKTRWIFGSYSNAFNDNSKHLYIYVVENHPEIDAIWISSNPKVIEHIRTAGGKALLRWSIKGIYACLTARYWFVSAYVSDINYYCSRKATVINLWHGIPLKKIEFDIENGPLAERYQRNTLIERYVLWPNLSRYPEYVLSTSSQVSRDSFASAFRIKQAQCLNFGYPRTDLFFKATSERLRMIERWDPPSTLQLIEKIRQFSSCLIYMPTWRDADPHFIESSGWDFPALNAELQRQNSALVLKLHVNTPQETLHQATNLSNIYLMHSTEDVYSILPFTSGLITDYSSIMFDYLLLNKPIFYYPFDREGYEKDSRGFYYEYESCIAGDCIKSPLELMRSNLADAPDDFLHDRIKLREKLFDHFDSLSSKRIVQKFLPLKDK